MTPLRSALALTAASAVAATTLLLVPTASVAAAKPMTYHQSDSGDRVRVSKGDTIRVVLKAPSGTGYSWRATKSSTKVYKVVSRRESPVRGGDSTEPLPGAPSRVVFKLRATRTGTATFQAQLRRSFGQDRVARRFSLTLRVVGS